MATTIVDIACQVGVSPRTVSRVLNTGGYVSEKVRRRVVRVAEELDYQPHAIARSFALRKTGNIGFVKTTESEMAQKAVGKLIEEISGKNTEPFSIITG